MLMRLDEIGENFLNLKAKEISYTTNKAEQGRGQKETAVPMELDYVSGSEIVMKNGMTWTRSEGTIDAAIAG